MPTGGLFDFPVYKLSITTDIDNGISKWICGGKKKELPAIRHVQFNKETGHTTIVWADGSEATVVRCNDNETFEPYMGFCAAIVKKLFGSTTAAKNAMEELDVDKVAARKEEERKRLAEERRAEEERNHKRKVRSMAKQLNMWKEAAELIFNESGFGEELEALLNTGDKDSDPDGNAV